MCSLLLYILSIISTTARQCYCMFTFFVLKHPPLVGFSLKNVIHCVIFTVVTSYTCVFRPDTLDNKSERCHTHYCLWTLIIYSFIPTCTPCKPKTKPQWYARTVGPSHRRPHIPYYFSCRGDSPRDQHSRLLEAPTKMSRFFVRPSLAWFMSSDIPSFTTNLASASHMTFPSRWHLACDIC